MRLKGDRVTQSTATRVRRQVTHSTPRQYRASIAKQYPGFYSSRPKIVYFDHSQWEKHRDAVVAAHKKARTAEAKAKSSRLSDLMKAGVDLFGVEPGNKITDSPLGNLLKAYAARNQYLLRNLNASGKAAAERKSLGKQRDLLWKIVHGEYGGKKPGVKLGTEPGAAGNVYASHQNVAHISDYLAELAQGANPQARAELAKVLFHEWAHTRQPLALWGRSRALTEGGAEAFAQDVARKYGYGRTKAPTEEYARFVRQVRRHPSFVKRGQFK